MNKILDRNEFYFFLFIIFYHKIYYPLQIQINKQKVGTMQKESSDPSEDLTPPESEKRIVARWNDDELLLAVHCIRKFGKNFQVKS